MTNEQIKDRPRGVLLDVDKLFPNPRNPKEMSYSNRLLLQKDLAQDKYDAIVVAPITYYYTPKSLAREGPHYETPDGVVLNCHDPQNSYMILDGHHKVNESREINMPQIRGEIWHMTEAEALPYFFKRNKIRGEMDPIKEALLFRYEVQINGLTRQEIVERYNLPGISYYKTRLDLLKISVGVANLFYKPPKDAPGELTISHLREISFLPKRLQKAVALMALERDWNSADVRLEVRRVKAGKGLSAKHAKTKVLKEPPPSRVNPPEPPLWQTLMAWEKRALRALYKADEEGRRLGLKDLRLLIDISDGIMKLCLAKLTNNGYLEYLETKIPSGGYRRLYKPTKPWEEITDEPLNVYESEPDPEELKPEEELLEKYPEDAEPDEKAQSIGEVQAEALETKDVKEETEEVYRPFIISASACNDLMHPVYLTGIREGLDLRSEDVDDELKKRIDAAYYRFKYSQEPSDLQEVLLRALQLLLRAELIEGKT